MSKFQIFLIVLYLFFFGAVGGWVLELLFRRFFSGANPERKWLNPGFLFGPCLPLYGFGTVLLFILSELDHQLFGSFSGTFWYYPVMFVVMALAMTLLEYIVGVVSFKGFHLRLWDYSKLWGNVQGIICPLFTFFWGVLSLAYYFLLYPRLRKLVEWFVAHPLASFMVGVCFGIFLIDLCSPSISARSCRKRPPRSIKMYMTPSTCRSCGIKCSPAAASSDLCPLGP